MPHKRAAIVLGTGRRLSLGMRESGMQRSPADLEALRAGAIPVTIEAFVECDAGDGY